MGLFTNLYPPPHPRTVYISGTRLTWVSQTHIPPSATTTNSSDPQAQVQKLLLWDRKTEGGFPETKVLKQRVRDQIDPKRDLGHSDVGGKKKGAVPQQSDEGVGIEGKVDGKVEGVRVNGRVEKAAESMVADMEAEGVPEEKGGEGDVKRNADGSVCEDCR